jgi:nicotinamidase-related amidase
MAMEAALIVIDVQQGMDDPRIGERNNPQAEENLQLLLREWREKRRPVIHVQHLSKNESSFFHPSKPGSALKPGFTPLPGELFFQKNVNSAFIGTDLEQKLRQLGVEDLVFAGFITDHCVSTTVRMAANLGFRVQVVADATATFERRGPKGQHYTAQQMHDLALASLHEEFAQVVDTAELLSPQPVADQKSLK